MADSSYAPKTVRKNKNKKPSLNHFIALFAQYFTVLKDTSSKSSFTVSVSVKPKIGLP